MKGKGGREIKKEEEWMTRRREGGREGDRECWMTVYIEGG